MGTGGKKRFAGREKRGVPPASLPDNGTGNPGRDTGEYEKRHTTEQMKEKGEAEEIILRRYHAKESN